MQRCGRAEIVMHQLISFDAEQILKIIFILRRYDIMSISMQNITPNVLGILS